jgi:hypothetical protein
MSNAHGEHFLNLPGGSLIYASENKCFEEIRGNLTKNHPKKQPKASVLGEDDCGKNMRCKSQILSPIMPIHDNNQRAFLML